MSPKYSIHEITPIQIYTLYRYLHTVDFILLFTVFICLASVVVGFGYFAVVGSKELLNNLNNLAK